MSRTEIIVVRSLADSDLALFGAHRKSERGRQRAININAPEARRILSQRLYNAGGGIFECEMRFRGLTVTDLRPISKPGDKAKNFRLSGNKVLGEEFTVLDSKDFMLIRTVEHNDGDAPIGISFVSRNHDGVLHSGLVAKLERQLKGSMATFTAGDVLFEPLALHCPPATVTSSPIGEAPLAEPLAGPSAKSPTRQQATRPRIPPMPKEPAEREGSDRTLSVKEKVRSAPLMERMLQVAGDLSAPAQLRFMETVEALATQLREMLLASGGIVVLKHDHGALWKAVAGQPVGFVDGGLANLSMLGSAPIAARVGGYVVTPGDRSPEREAFSTLKYLIDELYDSGGGVYADTYPDVSGLRDAARISIEAAGAVQLITDRPELRWLMVHGALVNPVSRYTDQREDLKIKHRFPAFSEKALKDLLRPAKCLLTRTRIEYLSAYIFDNLNSCKNPRRSFAASSNAKAVRPQSVSL